MKSKVENRSLITLVSRLLAIQELHLEKDKAILLVLKQDESFLLEKLTKLECDIERANSSISPDGRRACWLDSFSTCVDYLALVSSEIKETKRRLDENRNEQSLIFDSIVKVNGKIKFLESKQKTATRENELFEMKEMEIFAMDNWIMREMINV